VKDWTILLDIPHQLVSASGLLMVHMDFFSLADYSLANKDIKHVLKLYGRSSPAEYYDWEDDMEKFLWGRGLNSSMQLFYARQTFSEGVFVMVA